MPSTVFCPEFLVILSQKVGLLLPEIEVWIINFNTLGKLHCILKSEEHNILFLLAKKEHEETFVDYSQLHS